MPEKKGARVVPHEALQEFSNNGNTLMGIATPSLGSDSFEVWRTSVAVGSHTPPHTHTSEEVFIFLRGKGRAEIGSEQFEFTAPATVIAPAGLRHQFFNTGEVPTDAIVVVGSASDIYDDEGKRMDLPWRR
jgi:mannose-6-phosphate isomerase-like protein (cupin superfamily)